MKNENFMKNKRRILMAALANAGVMHEKDSILSGFGVKSTKELTAKQLDELINRFKDSAVVGDKRPVVSADVKKQRSVALGNMQTLGVFKGETNWDLVNAFLSKDTICGKLLYELDLVELKRLNRKLFGMIRARLSK